MNEQAAQLAAARRDWQLYHTLSEELLKFISQEDIDEFLSLTQQRTALVERMKKNPQTALKTPQRAVNQARITIINNLSNSNNYGNKNHQT